MSISPRKPPTREQVIEHLSSLIEAAQNEASGRETCGSAHEEDALSEALADSVTTYTGALTAWHDAQCSAAFEAGLSHEARAISPHIFLDVDGVLARWVKATALLFDLDPDDLLANWPSGVYCISEAMGVSLNEVWRRVDAAGHRHWADLETYPWTSELAALCFRSAPTTLLTSPSRDPGSASGKIEWIQREFGEDFRDYLLGPAKPACARAGAVLIDDRDKGCEGFIAAGGCAIVFPQPWNSKRGEVGDRLGYVEREIARWLEGKRAWEWTARAGG